MRIERVSIIGDPILSSRELDKLEERNINVICNLEQAKEYLQHIEDPIRRHDCAIQSRLKIQACRNEGSCFMSNEE